MVNRLYNMKLNLEKIIEMNKAGYTLKEVTAFFNKNHYQNIQSFLKYKGVKLIWEESSYRKINQDFFECIDSEIKAYLLGFFYADGTITKDNRVAVSVQEKDKYIVELFQKYISPEIPLSKSHYTKGAKNRQPQYKWRLRSLKIIQDLKKLGLKERKTYETIDFPDIKPSLMKHFIRGLMDGDGYVSPYPYGGRVYLGLTWKNFIDKIDSWLKENGLVTYISKYYKDYNNCSLYKLEIRNKEGVNMFYNLIYRDSTFRLERKINNFKIHNTEVIAKSKEFATP